MLYTIFWKQTNFIAIHVGTKNKWFYGSFRWKWLKDWLKQWLPHGIIIMISLIFSTLFLLKEFLLALPLSSYLHKGTLPENPAISKSYICYQIYVSEEVLTKGSKSVFINFSRSLKKILTSETETKKRVILQTFNSWMIILQNLSFGQCYHPIIEVLKNYTVFCLSLSRWSFWGNKRRNYFKP